MNGSFAGIAPYLKDPLILIGFFVFLFFGFGRLLIKSRLIPKLSQQHGYRVLQAFLFYGFVAGILIIALGFGIKYRELSTVEQGHVLSMLEDESRANLETTQELAKNTQTILGLMASLARTLRQPNIKLLAQLFPEENINALPTTGTPPELARSAMELLDTSPLRDDALEMARFTAAARAIHATVDRTLPTIDSLSDTEHRRYRIHEDVWTSQLPILRKIDAFPLSPFQRSYSDLARLRANYDVTVKHVHSYLVSIRDFLAGAAPINTENLAGVLSEERLAFSIVTTYGMDLADSAERLSALSKELPGIASSAK